MLGKHAGHAHFLLQPQPRAAQTVAAPPESAPLFNNRQWHSQVLAVMIQFGSNPLMLMEQTGT
jgi:hypothetical protein